MIQEKCDSDVDGPNTRPDQKVVGCKPNSGVDREMHRFEAISAWLDSLEEMPGVNEENIRVALVPFSGGFHARPRDSENHNLYKFRTLSQTRDRLSDLRAEQEEEQRILEAVEQGGTASPPDAEFMGTTAPRFTLDYMYNVLEEEMLDLREQEKLSSTPFQIIYLSDGVFKPIKEHWNKVWEMSGCNRNSQYELCYDLRRDFRNKIGDVEENTFEKTVGSFKSLLKLSRKYEEAVLSLRFVKIHPDRIPADDLNGFDSVKRNLYDEVKSSLEEEFEGIEIYNLVSGEPPFSLFGAKGITTYKIDSFYIMNLSYYVDDFGRSVADGDGDGLPDNVEVEKSYDPQQARTNGICLDIITEQYGCKLIGCDPLRDDDADGLNSCEEISVGSNKLKKDSDGDGILDAHEVLRGLSPVEDDRGRVSSPDGFTDHQHFLSGTVTTTDVRTVNTSQLIEHYIETVGEEKVLDNLGEEVFMSRYLIDISNVPVGPLLASETTPQFFKEEGVPWPMEYYPLGVKHGEDVNQVVYVIRYRSHQDPDDLYWWIYREDVKWSNGAFSTPLTFKIEKFHQLPGDPD
jgi:hypothetical protein